MDLLFLIKLNWHFLHIKLSLTFRFVWINHNTWTGLAVHGVTKPFKLLCFVCIDKYASRFYARYIGKFKRQKFENSLQYPFNCFKNSWIGEQLYACIFLFFFNQVCCADYSMGLSILIKSFKSAMHLKRCCLLFAGFSLILVRGGVFPDAVGAHHRLWLHLLLTPGQSRWVWKI